MREGCHRDTWRCLALASGENLYTWFLANELALRHAARSTISCSTVGWFHGILRCVCTGTSRAAPARLIRAAESSRAVRSPIPTAARQLRALARRGCARAAVPMPASAYISCTQLTLPLSLSGPHAGLPRRDSELRRQPRLLRRSLEPVDAALL